MSSAGGGSALSHPCDPKGHVFLQERAMKAEQDAEGVCVRLKPPSTVHRAFHLICDGPPWVICSEGTLHLQCLRSSYTPLCPPVEGDGFSQSLWALSLSKGTRCVQPCCPWRYLEVPAVAAVWHREAVCVPVSAQHLGSEINC